MSSGRSVVDSCRLLHELSEAIGITSDVGAAIHEKQDEVPPIVFGFRGIFGQIAFAFSLCEKQVFPSPRPHRDDGILLANRAALVHHAMRKFILFAAIHLGAQMSRISAAVLAAFLVMSTSTLSAQYISIGVRGTGSVPTGSFGGDQTATNTAVIEGAKNGFGYGLDVGVGIGPIGAYAGFDHIKFDCETSTCQQDGKYTLQGATVGVKLAVPGMPKFRPYVKGGVTFNDLQGGYGGSSSNVLTTDKNPGYEFGVGFDYTILGGIVALTPQARYVGQNLKARVPGVTNTATTPTAGVNYFTFDVGLSLHTPFGGGKK